MDSKNIDQLLSRYCSLHYNQEKTKVSFNCKTNLNHIFE